MPKVVTLVIIECRNCNGSYFGGDQRVTLHPGNEHELPDEVYFSIRKVGRCLSCKQREERTHGGKKKRFDRG